MTAEPTIVVSRLTRVLGDLRIAYVVGGSFASSLYGIPRATQDVDIVADLRAEQIDALVDALGEGFITDRDAVRDAVRRVGSFNVLHATTMFRADVFVSPRDEWSLERLKRGRTEPLETPDGSVLVRFSSAEDTLLHKLVWYRMGNEVSDRQWQDAVGLLKVQGVRLDGEYLDRWAPVLGVADLLSRARRETGK